MATDPFGDWYDASGVRTGIRRMLRDETDKVSFPRARARQDDHVHPELWEVRSRL